MSELATMAVDELAGELDCADFSRACSGQKVPGAGAFSNSRPRELCARESRVIPDAAGRAIQATASRTGERDGANASTMAARATAALAIATARMIARAGLIAVLPSTEPPQRLARSSSF